jgi:hypothetical protein
MIKYEIVKTMVGTSSGGEKTAWNVIDSTDGYVFDTFNLKRDAKYWVEQALIVTKN